MKSNQAKKPLVLPGEGVEPSRRAFLELAGFGLSAAALSGCAPGPATKLIPGVDVVDGPTAGRAYWLATTCGACSARCGVLARCRDGRPIKLEGNPEDVLTEGGLCATGQADVLSLYDSRRLTSPRRGAKHVRWRDVDREIADVLSSARAGGGLVRLLTGTENGPSTRAAIARFLEAHPGAEHVTYDAVSASALLEAHEHLFASRVLPIFHFDQARVIASFDADFLGTWIAPVEHARRYAAGRRPDEGSMSSHIQLEGRMSLTGTVADERVGVTPRQMPAALAQLCALLEQHAGESSRLPEGARVELPPKLTERLAALADSLWAVRGHGLVVCGLNDLDAQLHTAYANHLLGSYGSTLSIGRPSLQRMGDDRALWKLKGELDAGQVACLIVSGANPAYDLPPEFALSMASAGVTIQHTAQDDETAAASQFVLPAPHALEAWGDAEPVVGHLRLQQPAIPTFREARTLRHMLAAWSGDVRNDPELLRAHWEAHVYPAAGQGANFERFFDVALHDGVLTLPGGDAPEPRFLVGGLGAGSAGAGPRTELGTGVELVLYQKVGLLDGRHAHNPWLQELPDPVTKVTWDNYAVLSPARAAELDLELGDVLRIKLDELSMELPVLVQRGQHDGVVALALGYGRAGTDRFSEVGPRWWEGKRTVEPGETVGVNAAPLLGFDERGLHYERAGVQLEKTGRRADLAQTQDHHTLEVPAHLASEVGQTRDAVLTASLSDYTSDPGHAFHTGHEAADSDLWPADHESANHHWGMVVDLSSCTGCSACVVSCQAENNVPVVGKDEVRRHREMHWMRIDRYFEGEGGAATASHQPMFCQQCDNAPCESVCPVLATVHSTEGLNQQVYNRCVGTRYCANTCPYKVRRFNWFNYPREDKLENHSLNPDVTIRSRGVMEKCSFCAQRIQEARSEAIRRGVALADGDIQVACQQSCPTKAIVFGDLMDPESAVSKLGQRDRSYRVLEELNVKPSVNYLGRIKNTMSEGEHHG